MPRPLLLRPAPQPARSGTGEALAVLDFVELPGGAEQQEALRRIGAMLARSAR